MMNRKGNDKLTAELRDEVLELAAMVCNEELTDDQAERLDELLLDNPAVQ